MAIPIPGGQLQWAWLFWNVFIPTVGPPLFTLAIVGLWMTGDPQTTLDIKKIVADLSPWALCFYALTLIGSSYNELGTLRDAHKTLVSSMLVVGAVALIYAVFNALWRVNGKDVAHAPVYYVTAVLWFFSVVVCHWSYSVKCKARAAAPSEPPKNMSGAPAGGKA